MTRHVVLTKPDDILLVGNVGDVDPNTLQALIDGFDAIGINCVVFAGDIEIDAMVEAS